MSTNQDRQGLTVSQDHAPNIGSVTSGHLNTPWKYVPWHIAEGPSEVRARDGWLVCETCGDDFARLIAAAPDLLEACEGLLSACEAVNNAQRRQVIDPHSMADACAAVVKAKGLAPSSAKQVAGESSRDTNNE